MITPHNSGPIKRIRHSLNLLTALHNSFQEPSEGQNKDLMQSLYLVTKQRPLKQQDACQCSWVSSDFINSGDLFRKTWKRLELDWVNYKETTACILFPEPSPLQKKEKKKQFTQNSFVSPTVMTTKRNPGAKLSTITPLPAQRHSREREESSLFS